MGLLNFLDKGGSGLVTGIAGTIAGAVSGAKDRKLQRELQQQQMEYGREMYDRQSADECIECRKEKARNWRIRLAEELKNNPDALFITLTFNEENYRKLAWELFKKNKEDLNYTEQNEMCKKAVRRWLERIRKKTGKSVRHWMVTEKGDDFGRIHLHGRVS